VLVQIRPEEDSKLVVPAPWLMQVHPRYFCEPSFSYIIAGTEYLCFIAKSRKMETVCVCNFREEGLDLCSWECDWTVGWTVWGFNFLTGTVEFTGLQNIHKSYGVVFCINMYLFIYLDINTNAHFCNGFHVHCLTNIIHYTI
jgi:hypothetical protein